MQTLKTLLISVLSLTTLILFFSCEHNPPFDPSESTINDGNVSNGIYDSGANFDLFASHTFSYWNTENGYFGGRFNLASGHEIWVEDLALTPPEGTPVGEDIVISAECSRSAGENELVYTFGPSGSQFSPPLKIQLDRAKYDIDNANLFLIDEEGNYIEQDEDDINYDDEYLNISIHHFSRYAVSID
ncbi:MAG: hypothetical protein GF313_01545 [Caldithrix sp.]|nr:hypothetical protein [Caldithrix sp.]